MARRRKLNAGNWPTWEERIDSQLEYAFDHCDRLRETDHDLYWKVGEAQGRHDRLQARVDDLEARLARHLLALRILAIVTAVALVAALLAVLA